MARFEWRWWDDPSYANMFLSESHLESVRFKDDPPVPFVVPPGSRISWIGGAVGYHIEDPDDAAREWNAGKVDIRAYVYLPGSDRSLALPFAIRLFKLQEFEISRYLELRRVGLDLFRVQDSRLVNARLLRLLPDRKLVIPMFTGCDEVVFTEEGSVNAAWDGRI